MGFNTQNPKHSKSQTQDPRMPPRPPLSKKKVNADLLAKGRGLRISEVTVRSEGADALTSMSVSLGAARSTFSAAVDDKTGRIYVEGTVRSGRPYITKIGAGGRFGLGALCVFGVAWGVVGDREDR
jgi:hypothetical protein